MVLVNCPRCGFTQPEDQYCAQCGVDMVKFRPPKRPLASRLFDNAVLQITVVLAISGFVGYGLYQHRHSELQDRVRYLKGVQVAHSEASSSSSASSESASSAPANGIPAEMLNDASTADPNAKKVQTAAAVTPATKASSTDTTGDDAKKKDDASAAAKNAAHGPLTLHMVFAEVAQPSLMQIYDTSRTTGQFNSFGNFVAGILPDIDRRLSGGTGVRILGRETRQIDAQHPVQFFQGIHGGDPESEIGFSYYVEVTDGENESIRGNVEVARSWREAPAPGQPPAIQKTTFPAVFELVPGAGFFMAKLLPVTPVSGPDVEVLNVPPFQIERSNDFRGGQSEYVLFLTFERPRVQTAPAGSGPAAGAGSAAPKAPAASEPAPNDGQRPADNSAPPQ